MSKKLYFIDMFEACVDGIAISRKIYEVCQGWRMSSLSMSCRDVFVDTGGEPVFFDEGG